MRLTRSNRGLNLVYTEFIKVVTPQNEDTILKYYEMLIKGIKIYVYRPVEFGGARVGYLLRSNDDVIFCRKNKAGIKLRDVKNFSKKYTLSDLKLGELHIDTNRNKVYYNIF